MGVGVGAAGVGEAVQKQGARGVPQHCGASWGIRSRSGQPTLITHRYASLTGSVCPNRLAKPNRHLDHLRGIARGFRSLQDCTHRSLLHSGGFKHPSCQPVPDQPINNLQKSRIPSPLT